LVPRIALIHATPVAIEPIAESFRTLWPEARTTNLLEDSLSADLAAARKLTPAMHDRFATLATYAERTGADAVLFTCSAFGPCIETARRVVDIPVLKPNEAMIDEAFSAGRRVALIATFESSVPSMRAEIEEAAAARGARVELSTHVAVGALPALQAGDGTKHDVLIAETVRGVGAIDAVMLAQFSMARAERAVAAVTPARILTSPASAVQQLRRELAGRSA
jgi:Asp/Glu/hydantoin racemase